MRRSFVPFRGGELRNRSVADFAEITTGDLEILINVHLMGDVWMCRAAWPHMLKVGYGRIVNTTSGGMYGAPGLSVYGTAKYGIYGLTLGLAVEGFEHNIKANALSPGGYTTSLDPFFSFDSEEIRAEFIRAIPAERRPQTQRRPKGSPVQQRVALMRGASDWRSGSRLRRGGSRAPRQAMHRERPDQ